MPVCPVASVESRSSISAAGHLALDLGAAAGGVRADQRLLQLGAHLGRDVPGGQRAEPGRDAVRRRGGRGEHLDRRAGPADRGDRVGGELDGGAVAGDGEHVVEGERARRRRSRCCGEVMAVSRVDLGRRSGPPAPSTAPGDAGASEPHRPSAEVLAGLGHQPTRLGRRVGGGLSRARCRSSAAGTPARSSPPVKSVCAVADVGDQRVALGHEVRAAALLAVGQRLAVLVRPQISVTS